MLKDVLCIGFIFFSLCTQLFVVSSTRDDREQLIKEITMMQNLGFHSQIVGLLGACTKGRTLCLVLEYCPGGDLLTFIRKVSKNNNKQNPNCFFF